MQPNTMGELRLDNEHLRKENARLRARVTELEGNRLTAFTQKEVKDVATVLGDYLQQDDQEKAFLEEWKAELQRREAEKVAELTIVATAQTMKASDLGKAVDDLNKMIDRLEAEVVALKRSRWADRTDEDLEDLLDGCIGPEILGEVEAEIARREGEDDGI